MNQTALIVGGGRGAGLGTAKVLAEAGYNLAIADFSADRLEIAAGEVAAVGADVLPLLCDASDEEQVAGIYRATAEKFGGVSAVVNCVAWLDPAGPIVDLPTERWHKAIRTNLDSVMFSTREALRLMIPAQSGVIINFSSVSATRGFPDRASYGATKAAIINFTQTTAMEGREYGIRANCLVPGAIAGERTMELRAMVAQRAVEGGPLTAETAQYPGPEPEDLTPEWVGRFIKFLISPEGRFINGQAIPIGESVRSPLQSLFFDM